MVRLEVVDSTNRYAADAVRQGAPEGLVVVAAEQTAGRGRLGRAWVAPKGTALLCSLVFRPRLRVDELHLVVTAVALAAADAAQETGGVRIDLKWPNDLVAGDDKVGGILAEVVADRSGRQATSALVVGVGVNLGASELRIRLATDSSRHGPVSVTGLTELSGRAVACDDVLAAMLRSLAGRYGAQRRPDPSTMDEYRRRCVTIGESVRVDAMGRSFSGLARGIDDSGRLLVETAGGRLTLDAADVVHLREIRRRASRGNWNP
ncbi:MAG TPA: biotin--[acetyl-CoA-carboxylase] ligase [Acidimicrobiales bacterium]|nr:biotin--[acetyl-CoA-carboxylase] ligase [Acidimicrobiales bacterium]